MRRLSLFFLLFVAAPASPALAGTTVEVVKVRDNSLIASFDQFIATCPGGIDSAMSIQWNSTVIRADGVTTQTAIIVDMRYVNTCTGDSLLMSGFSLAPNGTVSTDLSTGHIDAVVPVATDPGDPTVQPPRSATVTLSLNFTGTGPTSTIRDTSHTNDGAIKTVDNFTISSRSGVATGTATAVLPLNDPKHKGRTVPTFVNLIGAPSLSATLGKDAFGNITITRKTP
ncbi:MAG TPA: hypothetical protein VMU50_16310 [Polyangia bacterium]|nr:hypothetical protein [Polyangia bacterium]